MVISNLKKRILAGTLAGCLLVLAGCGGQGESGRDAASEGRTDTESPVDAESQTMPEETDARDEAENAHAEAQTNEKDADDAENPADGEQSAASGTDETQEGSGDKAVEVARREEETSAGTKKLSILGDSISTFDGWIPEGYSCFFPMNGDVAEVEQTWWQMVLKDTGMELCVNGSSSGSTCIGDSTSADDCSYGCSDYRIGDLIGGSGCFPDVIIVYMGTNDFMKAVPLGDNDGTRVVEEGVIENFSDAYCLMLDKLIAYYPNAEIYCCNLPAMGVWGPASGPVFVPFVNSLELSPEDYGKRIETIAKAKGCQVIDLQNCGITAENLEWYVSDGVHLNSEGMKLIRDAVVKAMN